MKRNKHKRDGRYIDDYVVEDGGLVRVPAYLADGWRGNMVRSFDQNILDAHRPGYRLPPSFAATADVRAARREMIDRQREAWRGPGQCTQAGTLIDARRKPPPDDDDDEDDPEVQDARRFASREAWVRGLQDQWRVPASSPNRTHGRLMANADVSASGPGPAATAPANAGATAPQRPIPDDPQAKRDQAYQEYSAAISNAWRSPGAGPQRPGAGPNWKGPGA
jgi:hypothetical protein